MKRIMITASLFIIALVFFSYSNASGPTEQARGISLASGGNNGALPHDGRCVSYCARSIVYSLKPGATEVSIKDPAFNEADWEPCDANGDGKIETCLKENMCQKWAPGSDGCPEVDSDGDGVFDRCVLPGDGLGFWCRLMNGQNTHKHAK